MKIKKLLIVMGFSLIPVLFTIFLTGCTSGNGSNALPVKPTPPVQLRDSYDSVGIFAYHYPSGAGEPNVFFTQPVTGGGFGNELSKGSWQGLYETMASFEVGGYYYIMGHNTDGSWFIQQILPSGDLGPQTDAGTWSNWYRTLVGFQVGSRTFIFGQKDSNYWFVQEILPGGKMGNQTYSGTWHYFYETLIPLTVNGQTFLFGQNDSKQNGGYFWFIQQINGDGTMGNQICSGRWGSYWPTVTSLEVGGNTYIFGQKSSNDWFLQQITGGGWMGRDETDSGTWGHFFETVTSFQSGGNTYLFGQSQSNNFWFIQQVNPGGKMGYETASGNWAYYYNSAFAFNFSSKYQDVHNWMTQNWSTLNDKTLKEIVVPGVHDAGMSLTQHCYMAQDCNTKTQYYSIGDQLNNGARYFDIRPVRDWGGGSFYTGHFSIDGGLAYGCEGQLLQDVLNEVLSFVQSNPNEIAVLKFSHCYELSHAVGGSKDNCAPDGTTSLYVGLVRATLGDVMYKCTGANCLANATLQDIHASGASVVGLFDDGAASDTAHGVFTFDGDFSVYDEYSNTDTLSTMENDQTGKLLTAGNHTGNDMYLTSWTLTMTASDAINCSTGGNNSIIGMAQEAVATLIPNIWAMTTSGQITKSLLPNILYTDINDQFSARLALMINNYFYSSSVSVNAGDFEMGCNSGVDLQCKSDEMPYHTVHLHDFSIDKNMVTAVEYADCVEHGACTPAAAGGNCTYNSPGDETRPVNCVTWRQAGAYCQWVGKRLPTEAEWEKAARGVDGRKYPWGNDNLDADHAVMSANGYLSTDLGIIASKPLGASPYAALDMAGNASQWVADWYAEDYYDDSSVDSPQGPVTGDRKVVRGGSFSSSSAPQLRTSNRESYDPYVANEEIGFRCATQLQ